GTYVLRYCIGVGCHVPQPLVLAVPGLPVFSHVFAEETAMKNHAVIRHRFVVRKPVEQVFGLFDHIAEKDWAEGWEPIPVHPRTLALQEGSVFLLERDTHREIW